MILVGFFLGDVRAHGFGGVLEERVVAIDFHVREQRHGVFVPAFLGEDVAQALLDERSDGALRFGDAEVQRHVLHLEGLLAGLVLQHHVAHLRTVAVADDDIVTVFDQRDQVAAGLRNVFDLLLIGASLFAFQ